MNSGVATGSSENIHFEQAFTVFLNGQGGIKHVVNNVGNQVNFFVFIFIFFLDSPFLR